MLIPVHRDQLVNEVRVKVKELIEDQNGNHVIQKVIEQIDSSKIQFIVDQF